MKRVFKKNQVIIAALAVMIAAAGYLNYSGRLFPDKAKSSEIGSEVASQELLDISQEDSQRASSDIKSQDGDNEAQTSTPGEAVLTGGDATSIVSQAKITREQVRAKNKESLQEIIDNKQLTGEQKKKAVNEMVELTKIAEKEAAAETMLSAKGFTDSVVSLSEESADVVVNAKELSEANRAQIEDIVIRKTGMAAENIVITPAGSKK
ncbi:SpoIIIAH-like family protein [Dorea sp. NSJ-36]|uniref:SpoIIIAH-like family protein n=1 Tax=Dorea hominis TaxID=2763040 RepID=A0ABR7ETQ5_9FIRM|nr:SpoIIIAH-like family protein [Dorea hominis]